ncbi:hypothetical protein BDK51DRAFT_42360 [Blyttiomyces helicus]|uniref:Uncharacterized protein n=1 Tax=Blyttiomyces helicus TaxID=388810 RepID=A0A4P9WM41_9FUNG|nr:hypothetical protein BDK51DRAFT_42360 [Blyttiomyces helicus]|eukprot:RKO94129.1 hypothetical protein BDK51DRAFT_42360 [Blyttiomyces helicus]
MEEETHGPAAQEQRAQYPEAGPDAVQGMPVKRESRPTSGVIWDGDDGEQVRDPRTKYATPTYASLARRPPTASKMFDQKAARWSGLFSRGSPRSAASKDYGMRTASASSGDTLGAPLSPPEREDSCVLTISPIMGSRRNSKIPGWGLGIRGASRG